MTRPAHGHHGEGAVWPVVVQMMVLHGRAAAVATAVRIRQGAQPPEQISRLPHQHLPRMPLAVAPARGVHGVAVSLPPQVLPLSRLLTALPMALPVPRAQPIRVLPLVASAGGPVAHLAVRQTLASLVFQIELHLVLLHAAFRTSLREGLLRVRRPADPIVPWDARPTPDSRRQRIAPHSRPTRRMRQEVCRQLSPSGQGHAFVVVSSFRHHMPRFVHCAAGNAAIVGQIGQIGRIGRTSRHARSC